MHDPSFLSLAEESVLSIAFCICLKFTKFVVFVKRNDRFCSRLANSTNYDSKCIMCEEQRAPRQTAVSE
jgi:hypothetical protein